MIKLVVVFRKGGKHAFYLVAFAIRCIFSRVFAGDVIITVDKFGL